MSAPPMPAARHSVSGVSGNVRQSESSRGAELAEKVRQKLREDGLLDLLGEEPYTMEDNSTGPGYDDLCEYLPGALVCGADELKEALELVRLSVLAGDVGEQLGIKPQPIAPRRATPSGGKVNDSASAESEPGAIAGAAKPATKPEPGEKAAKPVVVSPAKPLSKPRVHVSISPPPESSSVNGHPEAESKPSAPKPRMPKAVSSSAMLPKSDRAGAGGDKPPVPRPVRHKPTLPPSSSTSALHQAPAVSRSSEGLYDNPPEKTNEDNGTYEDMSGGGGTSAAVTVRPRVKPPRPITTIDPGNDAALKRKSLGPPKPMRPQSSAPALSPTDGAFPEGMTRRSPSPNLDRAVPLKPSRRSTGVPESAAPAATPRKPGRDRSKTMAPAGDASPTAGRDGSASTGTSKRAAATVPENAVVEVEDSLYAEVTLPPSAGEKRRGEAAPAPAAGGDASPAAYAEPADAEKDKDKAGDKAETKAKKSSLSTLVGNKFGKRKKHATAEQDIQEESQAVASDAPTTSDTTQTPAPKTSAAKEPWSAKNITLTSAQLMEILKMVRDGVCTQEEAVARMHEENCRTAEDPAAAAATAAATAAAAAENSTPADSHVDQDALYETPGPPAPAPAPVASSSKTLPPHTTLSSMDSTDKGDNSDPKAKGATLKGKLRLGRKKKDAADDHVDGEKKKGKFGGFFPKKSAEKEQHGKEESPPVTPTSPKSASLVADGHDDTAELCDLYESVGPGSTPASPPLSAPVAAAVNAPAVDESSEPVQAQSQGVKRNSRTIVSNLFGRNKSTPTPSKAAGEEAGSDAVDTAAVAPAQFKLPQPEPRPAPPSPKTPEAEKKPAYDGPFVATAVVEMPYKPSPYDTESLGLEVDDMVQVIEMCENGSWTGLLNGKVGKFKFIYVRVLDEDPPAAEETEVQVRVPSPSRPASVACPPLPKTLSELFHHLNLPQYIETFQQNGYDDLTFFMDIDTPAALVEIGVSDPAHQEAILFMVDVLNAEHKKRRGSLSNRSHRLSRSGLSTNFLFAPKAAPLAKSRPLSTAPTDAPAKPAPPQARQRAATAAAMAKPARGAPPKIPPSKTPELASTSEGPSPRSTSPEVAAVAEKEVEPPRKPKPLSSAFAAQLESSLKANQTDKDNDAPAGLKRSLTMAVKTTGGGLDNRALALKAKAKRKSFEDGDLQGSPREAVDSASTLKAETKKRKAPAPPSVAEEKSNKTECDGAAGQDTGNNQPPPKPRSASRASLSKEAEPPAKPQAAPGRSAPPPRPAAPVQAESKSAPTDTPTKSARPAAKLSVGGKDEQPEQATTVLDTEATAKQMETLRKKLDTDGIKLSAAPNSLRDGTGRIPVGLVQRIAMDTRIPITVLAPAMEKLRQECLTAAKRTMVASQPVVPSAAEDWLKDMKTSCLYEWLQSIGLPMYNAALSGLGYDLSCIAQLTEEEMRDAGVSNVLHAKRILRAASSL